MEAAVRGFNDLPDNACPDGKTVGVLTLHPQFIAKTYHPGDFLREQGLTYVGSRGAEVTPEKWTRQGEPQQMETAELFVAGRRERFSRLAERLAITNSFPEQSPIRLLEAFRAPSPADKKRGTQNPANYASPGLFEAGLHLPVRDNNTIVQAFSRYAQDCGAVAEFDRRINVGGLLFIPVQLNDGDIDDLARFSFLRVLRPMPQLRVFHPIERSAIATGVSLPPLPEEEPLDDSIRMAIFDGGLPPSGPLKEWADSYDAQGVGLTVDRYLQHGHMVTSAALFGPLSAGQPIPIPFCSIDHYRVMGGTQDDPYVLYNTLKRIWNILSKTPYDFVNLSLGPALPIEDDEVHPWTSVLDELLSKGKTLLTVAAGNNGGLDRESGNARVQIPSDCVNALAVGSADSRRSDWERAAYSAVGPGRSPGLVKPDILSFGGSAYEPFMFAPMSFNSSPLTAAGTSFAAPAALRMAAGIRAHFGDHLTPLALKALLVHCAETSDAPLDEIGWGRIPNDIEKFVVCEQGTVRILYQGEIDPGQAVRMPIPLPEGIDSGMVTISATYCINSPIDARTPSTYTGSAIEPFFRPHVQKMATDGSTHAAPKPFFQVGDYVPESDLRRGAHKWETTKHKTKKFRASSLMQPVFDVRHLSRIEQLAGTEAETVEYALVLTLKTSLVSDIYNKVVRTYADRLEILQPQIEVPITIRP
ncbi:S8 family peptidase [Streptomyces lunaelactis]|uniref:S8 family peptidase n=1 Tax=Streptomyces lunaelactis TaxID=1535768 RepID=UPI001584AE9F|nr:S8 family peptidase [Streptomyces lunaelactis]NUK00574.1 S8 family peptidase [Streptomyces lunaelactis]NUK14735.1 S8 family peptidase [Streptomyces lunaelactis]